MHRGGHGALLALRQLTCVFCRCKELGLGSDPRGCFPLNHNAPDVIRPYNTTDDLLKLVQQKWLYESSGGRVKVYIYLCWKLQSSPCDDTSDGKDFIALAVDFYQQATSLISSLQLDLEFVMDGSGTVRFPCLWPLFGQWTSTYVDFRDPPEGFYSNNKSTDFNRYQTLDDPVSVVEVAALRDWGKFVNSSYPILVWEPSDEADINKYSDMYLNVSIKHDPGFLFAINIDPVQFQLYASPSVGGAVHQHIQLQSDQLQRVASRPLVDIITSSANGQAVPMGMLLFEDGVGSGQWYTVALPLQDLVAGQGGGYNYTTTDISAVPAMPKGTLASFNTQPRSPVGNWVLVTNTSAAFSLYTTDTTMRLSLVSRGELSVPALPRGPEGQLWDTPLLSSVQLLNDLSLVQAFTSLSSADCVGLFFRHSINNSAATTPLNAAGVTCVDSGGRDVSSFDSLGIAGEILSGADSEGACPTGVDVTGPVVFVVIVTSTKDNLVLMTTGCIDAASGTPLHVFPALTAVAVGSDAKVSVANTASGVRILSVVANSYCDNSEDHNKRDDVLLCDATPQSTSGVLSYTYGSAAAWAEYNAPAMSSNATRFFSACDATGIVHGVFDQGSYPSVALSSSGDMLEVHEGLPSAAAGNSDCGPPETFEGLVMDRWILPSL